MHETTFFARLAAVLLFGSLCGASRQLPDGVYDRKKISRPNTFPAGISGGGRFGGRGGGRYGGRGSYSHHSGGGGSSEPVPEGTQLYVGNIPFETNWRELKDLFSTVGEVQRVFVKTSESGRSKGFATVRFAKKEDAEKAINTLNGVDFQGRDLDVRLDNKA